MAKQNQKLKVEKFIGKYPFKRGLHLAGDYSFAGPILQAIDRFRFSHNNISLRRCSERKYIISTLVNQKLTL